MDDRMPCIACGDESSIVLVWDDSETAFCSACAQEAIEMLAEALAEMTVSRQDLD